MDKRTSTLRPEDSSTACATPGFFDNTQLTAIDVMRYGVVGIVTKTDILESLYRIRSAARS